MAQAQEEENRDGAAGAEARLRSRFGWFGESLAGRLLALTIAFVLMAEIVIFVPSVASFRRDWLESRVNAAQIAALALEAAPEGAVSDSLRRELLQHAEVRLVALQREGERVLQLDTGPGEAQFGPLTLVDLRRPEPLAGAPQALGLLVGQARGGLRVIAAPRFESGQYVEVVLGAAPLARDLRAHARRLALSSLSTSLAAGALVYGVLLLLFVRPMRRLTKHIELFRDRPHDAGSLIRPSGRADEIGRAEKALQAMGAQIRASLLQRERLAALGGAVAKIAHDLRNSLATASLVTERLSALDDPKVAQIAPRLERAIARAGGLAQAALRYGKAEEPIPTLAPVDLRASLDEAAEEALAAYPAIVWRNAAPAGLNVLADGDHLHRLWVNLLRNAGQALSAQAGRDQPGVIAVTATAVGGEVLVRVVDDGPGVPAAAQKRLFEPFSSAGKPDGAGLGLAIARELARAQGGDLDLLATGAEGTAFEVRVRAA